jgi:hypothetical protein
MAVVVMTTTSTLEDTGPPLLVFDAIQTLHDKNLSSY